MPAADHSERPTIGRGERALIAAAAAASAVVVGFMARQLWFRSDAWDFLSGRSLSDPSSLLREHANHWQTPTAVIYQVLQEVVGLDYWPWYYLPRLIAWSAVSITIWYVLRRRDTDRLVCFGVYSAVLFFGLSSWHNLATLGNQTVLVIVFVVAVLVAETPEPGRRQRILLGILLVLAMASTSLGLAMAAGTGGAIVLSRRLKHWWPSLGAAAAVYLAWYVLGRGDAPRSRLATDSMADLPGGMYDVMRSGLTSAFNLPSVTGALLVAGTIVALAWMVRRRRITIFELVFLGTLGTYLVLVVMVRVLSGQVGAGAERYGQTTVLMLVPVFVPLIRPLSSTALKSVAALVLSVIVVVNVITLESNLDDWQKEARASRVIVETAARLVMEGEPVRPTTVIDIRAGNLDGTRIEELLDEGWEPAGSDDPPVIEEARGNLRMEVRRAGSPSGLPLVTMSPVDSQGCVATIPPAEVRAVVRSGSRVSFEGTPGGTATFTWSDEFGVGIKEVKLASERPFTTVAFVNPVSRGRLVVQADVPLKMCGFAPSS